MLSTTLATVSTISPSVRPAARALEVRVFHFAALDDDASHEFQNRVCLARSGSGANSVRYVFLSEADLVSDKRVGAQAIAAQVAFGDGEGDLLADPGIESSISEYGAEIEKPFERHRRIAQHAEDVRHKTKSRHHIVEQSLGRTRRVLRIKRHDAIRVLPVTHTPRFSDARWPLCKEQFACQTAGAALLGNDEDLFENRPYDLIDDGREMTTCRRRRTRNRRHLDLDSYRQRKQLQDRFLSSAWHSRLQLRADLNDFFASRDHCPRYPLARNEQFREISGARDFPQCHKRLCVRKIHAATLHRDC
jgi:hypothetical protein